MRSVMRKMGGPMLGSLLGSLLSLSGAALAQGKANTNTGATGGAMGAAVSKADKDFMMEAAEGGLAEVQLGQLAKDKGMSDQVKNFGQKMMDDHSKANTELTGLAQKKGVTLPVKVSAKDQKEMDRLAKLSGAAFDKQYMKTMLRDHEKDIAAFKREAQNGKDTEVAAWAKSTLPVLEGHLDLAKTDEQTVKTEKPGMGTKTGK